MRAPFFSRSSQPEPVDALVTVAEPVSAATRLPEVAAVSGVFAACVAVALGVAWAVT